MKGPAGLEPTDGAPAAMSQPLAILGGGPVGLALALLLARRSVRSVVFDARSVEQASLDQRLLALSLGSLQTLNELVELPADALAPINTVVVSSVGQFGRAVIGEGDVGAEMLGATIRYGALVAALSAAAERCELISVRRPARVTAVRQTPASVQVDLEQHETISAPLALCAEGFGDGAATTALHAALVADVELTGVRRGEARERFTRDGPLALLPLPSRTATGAQRMALVWCMTAEQAATRAALSDADFIDQLAARVGERTLRVMAVGARARYPLHQQARDALIEHRLVYLGNAAQSLHPVAGQGLNLGLRDSAVLAANLGAACADGIDPVRTLRSYAQSRQIDRSAIVALTRAAPGFFATRFAPIALTRAIGLTALGIVPGLRREFARLLMFGVRF